MRESGPWGATFYRHRSALTTKQELAWEREAEETDMTATSVSPSKIRAERSIFDETVTYVWRDGAWRR